ncbi:hypothetical protein ACE6H2_024999 [Prunus campanulata]
MASKVKKEERLVVVMNLSVFCWSNPSLSFNYESEIFSLFDFFKFLFLCS